MYPVWNDDMYAKWLHLEQAVTDNPDKAYRQKLYKF